ncbi:nuclear transport factor 2 family protein [Motilimonas cestriensis]|uniref:Nuclear transport factor 2 family protein n=1 Tax=Motilimonas cestriensis TaxID=2742685 RepID=A0ABS8WGS1_9GAMM|nr:nuclear transport factor 2 family protein [Motilimonas cestriensis]MCE2597402.1 nuclear transport factor 2 family protein [Motilimonas cestriensis]
MNTEEMIAACEERLRLAQLKSDIDELSILIDEKLIFLALDGSVVGKADDLNLHRSPDFRIAKMEVIDRRINIFDGTAVVNTLMDASAHFGDKKQNEKIRYIRVWHKFSSDWRIISGSMRAESA